MPLGRGGEVDICSRCCTTIPHPALVTGSLVLHGKTVRRLMPVVERLTYLSKLPGKAAKPAEKNAVASRPAHVRQIYRPVLSPTDATQTDFTLVYCSSAYDPRSRP